MITPYMKFNQNLRGRVLFQDFFGRSVVERPSCVSSAYLPNNGNTKPRAEFPIQLVGCLTNFKVRPTNFVLCHTNFSDIWWFSGPKTVVSQLSHANLSHL